MRRPRVSFVATRSIVRASGFAFLIVAAAATTSRDGQPAARARALALDRRVDAQAQAQLTTAKAPLVFEPNRGQTASDVAFLARQQGYTLGIRATGARVQLKGGPRLASNVLELELVGASSHSRVEADERLPGHSNYFIGNVPAGYLRDVPHFGKVAVREVYPGIDLVYHGKQARVEYDFIVAPRGDLQRISLRFRGQASMNVSTDGDLVFRWGSQELRQQKPVLYQLPGREPVQGRFVMKSADTVGFEWRDRDGGRRVALQTAQIRRVEVCSPVRVVRRHERIAAPRRRWLRRVLDRKVRAAGRSRDGAAAATSPSPATTTAMESSTSRFSDRPRANGSCVSRVPSRCSPSSGAAGPTFRF